MKPRNHIVIALLKSRRKQGVHEKSQKAIRSQEKVSLRKKQLDL